jgi:hypothetical protein
VGKPTPVTESETLRPADDLVRAHDRIVGALLLDHDGKLDGLLDDEWRHNLKVAADVLCWALRHEHNRSFGTALEDLAAGLREHGYELGERPQ